MKIEEAFEKEHILELLSWNPWLNALWGSLIVGSLLVAIVPQLSCVSHHGKFSTTIRQTFFDNLLVPKRYFTHFYIIGSVITAIIIFLHSCIFQFTNTLALWLFLLHNLRRIWECLFITEYGQSTMHIGGYLCGLVHYIMYPITLELTILDREFFSNERTHQIDPLFNISVILFLCANILQYKSHEILFYSKRKFLKSINENNNHNKQKKSETAATITSQQHLSPNNTNKPITYPLPKGWGFEYTCCPHYFAEIVIYASLWWLEHHSFMMFLTFIWVLSNLSVVAYQQYCWYLEQYVEELEVRKLAILFPFLW